MYIMAYGRRRNFRKRGIKKSIAWKKPTAQNQKRQLWNLSKQVGRLQTVQRSLRNYGRYGLEFDTELATGLFTHGVKAINLTIPANWSNIFDNPVDLGAMFKAKTLSYQLDNIITSGSHLNPVTYTYFVVSLKSLTSMSLLNDTSGDLNNIIDGRHYSAIGGLVHINRKYFNVHYVKKFVVTSVEFNDSLSGGSNPQTTYKRFGCKVKFPRMLLGDQYAWRGLTKDDIKPTSRLYVLCFYNSPAEFGIASNNWKMNVVNTVVG